MSGQLLRIGICDDNQTDLERIKGALCQCLTEMAFECQTDISLFSDGRVMYEESRQRIFNLVFLDLEMPGWGGFDLAERLHMSSPETSIVFVSIHDSLVYQSFTYTPLWFVRKKRLCGEMTQAVQQYFRKTVPFPVSWTVKMKKKQKETQDILSYHTQAAGCSDKARAKASGGRQPIEECGRTGL